MNTLKKTFLLILALGLSGLLNAQKITLDYNAKQQQINMIGSDLERSAGFVQQAADPEQVIKWCFEDIPYTACRVSYDKKQEMVEGTKNMAFYDDVLVTMKMMRVANPDIEFYATMKSDYNGYGNSNNLPEWICDDRPNTFFNIDKYVGFLADYLELLHDNGVAATYMTVAKEWLQTVTAERTVDIIDGLVVELPKRGVPIPKFTDPSAWAVYQATKFVNSITALNALDRFYAFSTHNYGNSTGSYPAFTAACKTAGKYSWNDESGYGNGGRTNGIEPETLEAMLDAYDTRTQYYAAGLEGEMFFEITSRGIDSETRSVYFTSGGEAKRMRSYYVGKLFAENIYQRYYATASKSSLNSNVKTMSFVNGDEIALWVINNGATNFANVKLDFKNVNISGDIFHYAHTVDNKIQGDLTLVEPVSDAYSVAIKPHSVNYIEVKIRNEYTTTDVITLDQESLDFGVLASTAKEGFEKTVYVTVENPSTDVSISVSGSQASAFGVMENASIVKTPLVWYVPVKLKFTPANAGFFEALVDIKSGSKVQSIPVSGEVYIAETVTLPFADEFPNLADNTTGITNGILNDFSTYKGWTIENGISSNTTRIRVQSTGNPNAHLTTPEIIFNGPFELKFNARMMLNGIEGDGKTRNENDLDRNIFAILDGDTIYDHHKTGSVYFQNFNQWTSTFAYDGTSKIKFTAKVGTTGVWEGKTDGLIIGPNTDAIRVQSTTLPTVNIAYGHRFDMGELNMGTLNDFKYTIQGWNLTQGLTLASEAASNVAVSPSSLSLSGTSLSSEVTFRVNTDGMEEGNYTATITLTGESTQIKTRTITLAYTVVDPTAIEQVESGFITYGQRGAIVMNTTQNTRVNIFDMRGIKVSSLMFSGLSKVNLSQGIYIVDFAGLRKKVVVY